MKKYILFISLLFVAGCSTHIEKQSVPQVNIQYLIDIENHLDDIFHVTVNVENLNKNNNIYHFASTAPGTYQILDFGRFVKNFHAFDNNNNSLPVEKIGTNDWEIKNVAQLSKIEYDIEDSFDANVKEFPVSPMCGSGIENDFIAINTFAVLGYFDGLQSNSVELDIEYKSDWAIGTSLPKKDNFYFAETFDQLADSPILIGDLTISETFVNDISVQVYVYSDNEDITADTVMAIAEDILQSASGFIGYSPVPNYKFLICLLNDEKFTRNGLYGGGALEHSLSSLYIMSSAPNQIRALQSTMAHEFLHILTPLFLHSEIIHKFNFEEPTPSQHVWLYESVTEWASDIMQLRSGLIDSDRYMRIMSNKLTMTERFDNELSLTEIALNSYEKSGYGNFINFYERGAVTASLLDLKLLELSNGKRGLREVFLSLLRKYGKDKPFSENTFFNDFVKETYPEIELFFNKFIKDAQELPYKEYFSKIGYEYIPIRPVEGGRPSIGTNISVNENMEIITVGVQEEAKKWGLEEGDVILRFLGKEVNMETIRDIITTAHQMDVGDAYSASVKRGNEIIDISGKFLQRMEKHVFVQVEKLSDEQKLFKDIWMKNL